MGCRCIIILREREAIFLSFPHRVSDAWHRLSSLTRSRTALTQSILLLEKFYGLIFIRLSETTTEEMMCARVMCCVCVAQIPTTACLVCCFTVGSQSARTHNKTEVNDGISEYITNHIDDDDNDKYQQQIHIFIEFLSYMACAYVLPCLLFYFISFFSFRFCLVSVLIPDEISWLLCCVLAVDPVACATLY